MIESPDSVDFQLDLLNPCTLMPTDFQLYRKMKQIFFSYFFWQQKNEIGLPFSFCICGLQENFSPTGSREERS